MKWPVSGLSAASWGKAFGSSYSGSTSHWVKVALRWGMALGGGKSSTMANPMRAPGPGLSASSMPSSWGPCPSVPKGVWAAYYSVRCMKEEAQRVIVSLSLIPKGSSEHELCLRVCANLR